MRILVSNDDGYFAPGITAARRSARQLGEVTVVAPERDRSGASNSLTLDRPLTVRRAPNGYFSVNGTPTDCVHIAVTGLLDFTPDIVVSGINHGANMGDDTIYSGTVAAATEGYLLGIPSIALSLTDKAGRHFDSAVGVARELVERFRRAPIGEPVLLNVNVPDVPAAELRGIEVTRLGKRHKAEPVVKLKTPRGETAYWIGPAGGAADAGPGTDFHAVENRRVSITPLHIDLTHNAQLALAKEWLLKWQPRDPSKRRRHRHDLGAHARAHGRAAARAGHPRRARARRDGRGAAPPVRRGSARQPRLRGHRAADRLRADHLAALHRGAHDRSRCCDEQANRRRCSRSAPAAATRRRCWRSVFPRGVFDRAHQGAARARARQPARPAAVQPAPACTATATPGWRRRRRSRRSWWPRRRRSVPEALLRQLAPGGRMVLPLRERRRRRAAPGADASAAGAASSKPSSTRCGSCRWRREKHDVNRVRLAAVAVLALGAASCSTYRGPAPVEERAARRAGRRRRSRAAAAAQAPKVAAAADGYYTVKQGDTLYSIALDHGADYREVAQWNALDDPTKLRIGQVLRVKAPEAEQRRAWW